MSQVKFSANLTGNQGKTVEGATPVSTLNSVYAVNKTLDTTNTTTLVYDAIATDNVNLDASGTYTIDLQDMTDIFEDAASFANVAGIYIVNTGKTAVGGGTDSTASITVGGALTNAFTGFFGSATDTVKVFEGDVLPLLASKYGVDTAADNKDILITNDSDEEAIGVKVVVYGTKVVASA